MITTPSSRQAKHPPDVPASVGPWRVLEPLGRGGMGVVYRAQHSATGALAALKTVCVSDESLVSSIRREIHALRGVQHPGVVRILDEGIQGGIPWYAMELLEGSTLRDHNQERWRGRASVNSEPTVSVSAGFDAHRLDPLANLRLEAEDFAWATRKLMDLAGRHCGGRVVSLLEGGYDLQGLSESTAAHVRTLMEA